MNSRLKAFSFPAALLLLCVISFGLQIPSLGFYWDDWPSLVIARLQGLQGFKEFFSLDRPTTYVSYVLLMPLLGANPAAWQIFSLLMRWVTAVLLWWTLRNMWPDSLELPAWAAMLFAVHPIFHQQPVAMTYHQLWLEYAFFVFSLGAMITAVRKPHRAVPWTIAGMVGLALNFLISEYFLGVELLRPAILWLAIYTSSEKPNFRESVRRTILRWLPYLAVLLGYLAWRFLFLTLPGEDRNALVLFSTIRANPIAGLTQFAQMALQDTLHVLIASWYGTLQPSHFDLNVRFNIAVIGLGVLTAVLAAFYLFRSIPNNAPSERSNLLKSRAALLSGLLLVLIAPLPAWVTERQITVGAWSDRLAAPAMIGASLVIAALIAWLIRSRTQKIVLVCILLGLAVSSNVRVSNDYRWARIQQNRFYWELYWRAPGIALNTAIFAEAEVLPKTGLYSTAAGINLIYAETAAGGNVPYWFYSITRQFSHQMNELLGGIPLSTDFRQFTFTGNSKDGFILYYEPNNADCLRVLTKEDVHDPALSEIVVQSLPITNLERIQSEPSANSRTPDAQIFGPEPEQGWCYYFEKADLARQTKDWQQVASLGDTARDLGYTLDNSQSNTPQEWIPFIQGYGMVGRWDESYALTRLVLEREPKMSARLCDVWSALKQEGSPAQNIDPMLQELSCVTE